MANANVYMFNQTPSTANVIINDGTQFTISGTSDTLKWVAATSLQAYQSPGTVPGNLNGGQNKLEVQLNNQPNNVYSFQLPSSAGSIQVHILSADQTTANADLIVLVEGQPTTTTLALIAGTPVQLFVK